MFFLGAPERGTILGLVSQSFDPDAAAYFTARPSITSAIQKSSLNDLVVNWKNDGLWSGTLDFMLLCLGSFSDTFVKLKGSAAATNHSFVSGDFSATGAALGLVGDGATKWVDTGTANSILTQASFSILAYASATTTAQASDAVFGRDGEATLGVFIDFSATGYGFGGAQFTSYSISGTPYAGAWTVVRQSATSLRLEGNGLVYATNTNSDTTAPPHPSETGSLFANMNSAGNGRDNFSNRTLSTYVSASGWTPTQSAAAAGNLNRFVNLISSGPWKYVGPWVMGTFFGDGTTSEVLRMIQSTDGVNFTYLPCTLTPTLGTVRDPSFYPTGNRWYLAYTTSGLNPGTSLGVAACRPYAGNFQTIANVSYSSIIGIQYCYCDSLYINNGNVYLLAAVTTNPDGLSDFQTYYCQALTADLTSWGPPILITGSGFAGLSIVSLAPFVNPQDVAHLYASADRIIVGDTQPICKLIFRTADFTGLTGWVIWQDVATHNSGKCEGGDIVSTGGANFSQFADFDYSANTGMATRVSIDGMATWGEWTSLAGPTVLGASKLRNGYVLKIS